MKTIITYGTFDLFHIGHVRLLRRAALLGDQLIVGCSSDEFNALKGKKSVTPYRHREEILLACKFVSFVLPEHNWEQKRHDIIEYNADVLVMGNDWEGKFNHFSDICTVHYLPRTEEISTSATRDKITKGESFHE